MSGVGDTAQVHDDGDDDDYSDSDDNSREHLYMTCMNFKINCCFRMSDPDVIVKGVAQVMRQEIVQSELLLNWKRQGSG